MGEEVDRIIHLLNLPKIHDSLLPRSGIRPMTGDLDIASHELLTTNLSLGELDSSFLQIMNRAKTGYKNLLLAQLTAQYQVACNTVGGTNLGLNAIRCYENRYWAGQAWNGSAYVTLVKWVSSAIPLIYLPSLPVVDPGEAGALWNDGGTVKVSSG
ncbi:MAG: hypothetical protein HWN68_15245 [Desulfobacterales bacterium]|nr:hypothetical protein [Desulfobacterales bacterium]